MSERLSPPIPGIVILLRIVVVAALAASLIGVGIGGSAGRSSDMVAVALIIAAPLLRVVVLAVHWMRLGDRRYSFVAMALLAVVGIAALIAAW